MKRTYVFRKQRWQILFRLIDGIGYSCFKSHTQNLPAPSDIKKILLMRLDHLGDGILLTPFLYELRKLFPNAKIYGLFSKEISQFLAESPYFEKIWTLEKHWLSRPQSVIWSKEIGVLLNEIQKEKIDLSFEPRGDFRNILFLKLADIPHRVGFSSGGGGFLLTCETEEKVGEHVIERNLRLLRDAVQGETLGMASGCEVPEVYPEPLQNGSNVEVDFALIHAGAGTEAKRWPLRYWQELVQKMTARGLSVVIAGKGPFDLEFADRFRGNPKVINRVNTLSLGEIWTLAKRAKIFIGIDSGLAHGVASLGVKTIVLESGTNEPEKWSARGQAVKSLRYPVFCSPCHLEKCRFAVHECMQGIRPTDVEKMIGTL